MGDQKRILARRAGGFRPVGSAEISATALLPLWCGTGGGWLCQVTEFPRCSLSRGVLSPFHMSRSVSQFCGQPWVDGCYSAQESASGGLLKPGGV